MDNIHQLIKNVYDLRLYYSTSHMKNTLKTLKFMIFLNEIP